MCAVAGIHDGHWGYLRRILGGAFDIMAHHNHVGVVRYHQDGVLQCLALGAAGNLRIGKSDNTGTQTVSCCFKTKSGSG